MTPRAPRTRRQPSRADEVISHAPLPRTTTESSAPPEPVTTATVTTPMLQHNSAIERMWTGVPLESNAGEPIAVEVPTIRESENDMYPEDVDEPMPQLITSVDSDSSEDEEPAAVISGAEDRAAQIAPVATPAFNPATRARAPALQETLEVTITEEPSEIIRSRLLAHRDRASQSPAAATPREFSRMDVDEPLLVHMHDILVATGRTIPSQQCALALAEIRAHDALPVPTTRPRTVANVTSASASSNTAGSSDPVQAMLARRFTAEREDYAYIETCPYGSGYLDLLRVKRVLAVCQALGIRHDKPRETVRIEHMEVSYGHVQQFLQTTASIKNAITVFKKAHRVHAHLQAQERGARLVDETLLHQQLNFMLNDEPIGEGNRNPVAAQAALMGRGYLTKELEAVLRRIGV